MRVCVCVSVCVCVCVRGREREREREWGEICCRLILAHLTHRGLADSLADSLQGLSEVQVDMIRSL